MESVEIGSVVRRGREHRGWSQEELAERAGGVGQSTIDRIEKGQFKRMPSNLPQICAALGIPLPEFGAPPPLPGTITPQAQGRGDRNFPIHAAAQGGPGEIIVSSDPIDFIPRPGHLQHVKEGYGLVITGTSMFPEYREGETALVNPRLPVISGENYVFYAEKEGEARATIKGLRRATESDWHVEQHNPPRGRQKEFSLSRKEWRWAHRLVGKHTRS